MPNRRRITHINIGTIVHVVHVKLLYLLNKIIKKYSFKLNKIKHSIVGNINNDMTLDKIFVCRLIKMLNSVAINIRELSNKNGGERIQGIIVV